MVHVAIQCTHEEEEGKGMDAALVEEDVGVGEGMGMGVVDLHHINLQQW